MNEEETAQFINNLLHSGVYINQIYLGPSTINYGTINNYAANSNTSGDHAPNDNTSATLSIENLRTRRLWRQASRISVSKAEKTGR